MITIENNQTRTMYEHLEVILDNSAQYFCPWTSSVRVSIFGLEARGSGARDARRRSLIYLLIQGPMTPIRKMKQEQ